VVSPGPLIDLDEVGVSQKIAMTVERVVTVTHFNIGELTERVHRGPSTLDGALRVICTADPRQPSRRERVIDLKTRQNRESIRLLPGWKVARPLKNGDYVLFNRQPSLHKVSLMGHRVVILPEGVKTHNLSPGGTSVYNADFDGDEMNIFAQNEQESWAEIAEIMALPKQFLLAQNNKPGFGLVQVSCARTRQLPRRCLLTCKLQDSLVYAFFLTHKDTFLTRDRMMQILMWRHYEYDKTGNKFSLPVPAILAPQQLWTGKQLFSMLIPGQNLNLEKYVFKKRAERSLRSNKQTGSQVHTGGNTWRRLSRPHVRVRAMGLHS
jgi:DNA-directed RNA polymerase II subunit RPB1